MTFLHKLFHFQTILILAVFFFSCSEELSKGEVINRALDYIQHKEITVTLEPDDGWIATKLFLALPYSKIDKTTYLQINQDKTLTFFNITNDCNYHNQKGISALQSSSGVFSETNFSDIYKLISSHENLDKSVLYFLEILFSEDIQIFTEWYDCEDHPLDELKISHVVLQKLVFSFQNETERDEYRKQLEILIDAQF